MALVKSQKRHFKIKKIAQRNNLVLRAGFFIILLIANFENISETPGVRTCYTFARNSGYWNYVWNTYDENRFKKTFRISRATFLFILSIIKKDNTHDEGTPEALTDGIIPPDARLAITLYRLARGDSIYTIEHVFGYFLTNCIFHFLLI